MDILFIVMFLFSISVSLKYVRGTLLNHVARSLIRILLGPDDTALQSLPTFGFSMQLGLLLSKLFPVATYSNTETLAILFRFLSTHFTNHLCWKMYQEGRE